MASEKQELWLSEYLQCLNATEAARRAGYKWPDKVGAANKALFKEQIQQILAERIPSPAAVVSRVADMAMADMTDYLNDDGSLDLERMKADGRGYLLKKYRHTRHLSTRKDGSESESETWESELYPADAALDKLMRYHGLFVDRHEITGKDGRDLTITVTYKDKQNPPTLTE
jgi:hypothetical protein